MTRGFSSLAISSSRLRHDEHRLTTSTITRDADGLTMRLDWRGVVFGLSPRTVRFADNEIVSEQRMAAADAQGLLRWRVAGTAVPGWWLMGWFSRATRDGRWAWVWITPKRDVVVIETTRRRRSLVIVPNDWFVSGGASAPTDT